MWAKWNSLNFTQRFALGCLFLFLLVMPAAVWLALSPTSPFSRAGGPVSGPGGEEIPATLSFFPDSINVNPDGTFWVDVMLDTGSHEVTAAEIFLTYDGTTLTAQEAGVTIGDFLPIILEAPTIPEVQTLVYPPPLQTISFAVGSKAEAPVSGYGKIATIKFVASGKEGNTTLSLVGSQVAAIYKQTNVASTAFPASVKIAKDAPSTTDNLFLNLKFEGVATNSASPIPVFVSFEPTSTDTGQTKVEKLANARANGDGVHTAGLRTPKGSYNVFVKGPVHLRKSAGTFNFINAEKRTNMGILTLVAGDITGNPGENKIDIFDYNIIVQDFGPRMPVDGSPADLDLDGDVDIFDYNLVVQNFGKTGD